MRDLTALIGTCAGHGENIGIYAERLLDDPLPWTRMRSVYRLLGLVRRYGPGPVETACSRSLDLDVVSVAKIASMLEKETPRRDVGVPAGLLAGHVRLGFGLWDGSRLPTSTEPVAIGSHVEPRQSGSKPALALVEVVGRSSQCRNSPVVSRPWRTRCTA